MVKKTKDQSTTKASDEEVRKLPIELINNPTVTNHFANYSIVQYDGDQDTFALSFYEVQKPPFMGSEDEVKAAWDDFFKKEQKAPAFCVGRIILNPPHFKRFVATLQDHVERHNERKPNA